MPLFTYLLLFRRLLLAMPIARLLASAQSTALCDSTLMKPFLPTTNMIGTGTTHGVPISHVRQAGTPLSFLTISVIVSQLPRFWINRPVGLLALLFIVISAADVSDRQAPDPLLKPWPCEGIGPERSGKPPQRPVARCLRTRRSWLCHKQFPSGELPRDHPEPLRRTPQQGHFHARLHVYAYPHPLLAQVLYVGRRGHGGHSRQCSHQQ